MHKVAAQHIPSLDTASKNIITCSQRWLCECRVNLYTQTHKHKHLPGEARARGVLCVGVKALLRPAVCEGNGGKNNKRGKKAQNVRSGPRLAIYT